MAGPVQPSLPGFPLLFQGIGRHWRRSDGTGGDQTALLRDWTDLAGDRTALPGNTGLPTGARPGPVRTETGVADPSQAPDRPGTGTWPARSPGYLPGTPSWRSSHVLRSRP